MRVGKSMRSANLLVGMRRKRCRRRPGLLSAGKSGTLTKGAGSALLNADTVHVSFSPDGLYLALMYDGRDEPGRIDVVDVGRLAAGR